MDIIVRLLVAAGLLLPQFALIRHAVAPKRAITLVRPSYDNVCYAIDTAFRILLLAYSIFGFQIPWTVVTLPAWVVLTGAAGFTLTHAVVLWCRLALGQNLIPGPGYHEGQTLTTSGPYKYVRHPMYACYFVAAAMAFMATGDLLVGALGMAAAMGYSRFADIEEKLMHEQLPRHAYHDYRARTGKFLPGI